MFNNRLLALALASLTVLTFYSSSGGGFTEDFSSSPAQNGWNVFGDTTLFAWNATNQNLEVTWDSSQPNSYFYRSLGTILTREDDFSFSFDLRLSDFTAGINPLKPYPFQLALSLLDLGRATQTNFVRGTGADSPELVEFSFFPDPGGAWIYGPSLTSSLIDATGTNWATGGFGAQSLTTTDLYHITLTYTATNWLYVLERTEDFSAWTPITAITNGSAQTLRTTITRNGADFGQVSEARLAANFQDFQVNCFAICNYSDAGQDPAYAGSILAHGTVDNITVATLAPPVSSIAGQWVGDQWGVYFATSNGGNLLLLDTNPPVAKAFYRVQAQKP